MEHVVMTKILKRFVTATHIIVLNNLQYQFCDVSISNLIYYITSVVLIMHTFIYTIDFISLLQMAIIYSKQWL